MRSIFAILMAGTAFGQVGGVISGVDGQWFNRVSGSGPRPGNMQPPAMTCAADGVVVSSIGGQPIPRAQVVVNVPGGDASATTDGQGRWSMTAMPCGSVRFQAQKTGFLNAMMGGMQGRTPIMAKPVVVRDGSPIHDVKIELTPQGVVVGKVIDENGEPLQNVQIMMITSGVQEGKRQWQQRGGGQTNDLGEYRLHGLMPGKVVLCAHAIPTQMGIRSQRTVYAESCFPGPAEGTSASTIEVLPGREIKVDFTLAQTAGVSVKGTVTGLPTNRGMGLQLRKREQAFGGMVPVNTRLLPEGGFEISNVSPGSYILSANVWDPQNRLSGEVPVEVGSSDVTGVQLTLSQGFAVTGALKIESTGDRKPGVSMPPGAMPANIMLRPASGFGPMGPSQVKWSDDKQSFTLSDVMPGRYRVDVNSMGPYYVKSVRLGDQDLLGAEITLQQASGPIEVVLSDDSGTVQGTLKDAAGNTAIGQVMLLSDNGRRPVFGVAMNEGQFTVMNVPPGNYKMFAWTDPQQVEYANPDWMRQHGGDGVSVSVSSKQTAKVEAKQTALP